MENNIKVEEWFGKEVKFVEVNGEWLAVANDVAKALGYKTPRATINNKLKDTEKMSIQIVYASKISRFSKVAKKLPSQMAYKER